MIRDHKVQGVIYHVLRGSQVVDTKDGDILMTGGGALNIGLRKAFEEELMKNVYVASHPQFNGAIGAALIASERG